MNTRHTHNWDSRWNSVEGFIAYCADRFDADLDERHAVKILKELPAIRNPLCWIMNRLRDLKVWHCGRHDDDGYIVTALFHFWPWDESLAGQSQPKTWEMLCLDVPRLSRSPLSRFQSFSPIDRVARRIAGDGDKPCPYCNQYFRNGAALKLHLEERHSIDMMPRYLTLEKGTK